MASDPSVWGNFRFPTELNLSKNRFSFTGYELDPETGLYNAKARYFDPQLGRFLTQDSYLGQVDNPPSLHRYFYANDNPTRFLDPTGNNAIDYLSDAGLSLYGFGKGVAKGSGQLVVGTVVGTGKLLMTGAKLQFGTPEMKLQAVHELGEMGTALLDSAQDQARLLKQAASDPGQILDAAGEIGPERYGEVIGGATVDTAVVATIFTGVGAEAKAAQAAGRAGAEAVVVGESRVTAATAAAEQAATRARLLANIQESQAARAASRFAAYAESPAVLAAEGEAAASEALALRATSGTTTRAASVAAAPSDSVAILKSIRRFTERLVREDVAASNPAVARQVRAIQRAIRNEQFGRAGSRFHSLNFRYAKGAQARGFLQDVAIDEGIQTPGGIRPTRRPDYGLESGEFLDIKPWRNDAKAFELTDQFQDIFGATGRTPVPLYYRLW